MASCFCELSHARAQIRNFWVGTLNLTARAFNPHVNANAKHRDNPQNLREATYGQAFTPQSRLKTGHYALFPLLSRSASCPSRMSLSQFEIYLGKLPRHVWCSVSMTLLSVSRRTAHLHSEAGASLAWGASSPMSLTKGTFRGRCALQL